MNRWFVLLLGIGFMIVGLFPEINLKIVRMLGKMDWAEQRLGTGGTFNVWKWIGILAPILAMIYFFSGGYSPTNGWNRNQDIKNSFQKSYESYSTHKYISYNLHED